MISTNSFIAQFAMKHGGRKVRHQTYSNGFGLIPSYLSADFSVHIDFTSTET
jgi:hypothetical protein